MTPAERAVIEAPHLLSLRLALADAVAATDPGWSAFIRAGVRLARLAPHASETAALEREVRVLYRRGVRKRIYDPHAAWLAAPILWGGHVEGGSVDAADFLAHADARLAALPVLHLDFTAARPHLGALLAAPWIRRLRSLTVCDQALDDRDAAQIARCAGLTGLRYLGLPHNQITEAGVEAFARSPFLASLQYLDLRNNPSPPLNRTALTDQGAIIGFEANPYAAALVAKVGHRPWLDRTDPWPPERARV